MLNGNGTSWSCSSTLSSDENSLVWIAFALKTHEQQIWALVCKRFHRHFNAVVPLSVFLKWFFVTFQIRKFNNDNHDTIYFCLQLWSFISYRNCLKWFCPVLWILYDTKLIFSKEKTTGKTHLLWPLCKWTVYIYIYIFDLDVFTLSNIDLKL